MKAREVDGDEPVDLRTENGLVWTVEIADGRYRAELWHRPYRGWMVAATRWVSKQTWARRDGRRVFAAFKELQ